MKISEAYDKVASRVDEVQRGIRAHAQDQVSLAEELSTLQDKMKRLMALSKSEESDRDLTGVELLNLVNLDNVAR